MNLISILISILELIYLLVPAAVANMMPVLFKKVNFLNYPIDFGLKLGKNRLFGEHKTFRGFFFGMLGSLVIVLMQGWLYRFSLFYNHSYIHYNETNIILFGIFSGFSVLLFDSIASFIKRRLNFKSGESFYFLDQINGGLGFGLFLLIYFAITKNPSPDLYSYIFVLFIILVWLIGHLIIKYLGYLLKLDKEKI